MTVPVLDFRSVSFAYNGARVLDSIDLSIAAGSVVALMGPSGCGKSTLIAIAAGLLAPISGRVHHAHRCTAIMFQDPLLLPWRTALNNVAFALKADGLRRSERLERARAMLAAVGLEGEALGKYPRQLSGGMRQRVALARALVVEPDLLLLDEPFSGLDISLARQMLALVRGLVAGRGMSALVVTHDVREAARFAETVFVLSSGPAKVLATRDFAGPAEMRTDAEIEANAAAILGILSETRGMR